MKWLTNEQLAEMTSNAAAAQQETPVQDLPTATAMPATAAPKKCSNKDMQCIINRHKTASALQIVIMLLFILLLLKWLSA